MSAGVSFTNTVKYALDAKLVALHGAALVAAEKKDPLLANSYGDILQKRLLNKPGQEYEREGDAKSFQQMMDTVENAWRRMVIKEEGDDKLTVDDGVAPPLEDVKLCTLVTSGFHEGRDEQSPCVALVDHVACRC